MLLWYGLFDHKLIFLHREKSLPCGDGSCKGGSSHLGSQFSCLFRIVIIKNLPISPILESSYPPPLFLNFNFHCNLSNFEIEDLERLMFSLSCLHLSPSAPDARTQSLSSLGLFTVLSFFVVLSNHSNQVPFFPTKKSQAPLKVKSFA